MSSHCSWTSGVRRLGPLALLGLGLCATLAVRADEQAPDVSGLSLPGGPVTSEAVPLKVVVDSGLADATGEVQVVVQTLDTPLVVAHGEHYKQYGGRMTGDQQREHVRRSRESLEALVGEIRGMGGRELGRVNKALVAAAVAVDASKIDAIAKLPNVRSIRRVRDYQLDLTETVPYIGAKAVQAAGIDGRGVKVAVLDSGIDYTHSKLGGPGSVAEYLTCYATNTTISDCPDFPNPKVIGGYDFVGETWPTGSLAPDPDPIAMAGSGFHGTHVADIIAGLESTPGAGDVGVAPGASLYAVKVCSAVSTSCSGVALLQGMDFALDPNGDGDISDAVDVVNMSLGSSYGQKEDDLSEASANAVHAGVVVVASAGNSGDLPYVVGSPSSTPEVISVAQTQVPSALNVGLQVNSPASIAGVYRNTSTVDWAPIGTGFTGNVAYVGRGCPASGSTPADAYLADPSGKVALIDRGACGVSLKVDRAAKAGAIGVLIGLVAPGAAVSFSYGGGDTFVPTLVIGQADSNMIKANIAAPVNVTVSPATAMSLARGHGQLLGARAELQLQRHQAGHRRARRIGLGRGRHGHRQDRLRRNLRRGTDGVRLRRSADPEVPLAHPVRDQVAAHEHRRDQHPDRSRPAARQPRTHHPDRRRGGPREPGLRQQHGGLGGARANRQPVLRLPGPDRVAVFRERGWGPQPPR